jgi:hypothetical protein
MKTERILALADHIEKVGDEHFNMSAFSNRGGAPTACGSTACVAGWVIHIGLQAGEITRATLDSAGDKARGWLGIDEDQASALFYPEGYSDNRDAWGKPYTAARAGAVLRHLAETDEVDWGRFNAKG